MPPSDCLRVCRHRGPCLRSHLFVFSLLATPANEPLIVSHWSPVPNIVPVNRFLKIHVLVYFTMSFDHLSTSSNQALMSLLDDFEATLCNNIRTHYLSLRTARTNFTDDIEVLSTWATCLNRENVENGYDGACPKMEQK